MVRHPFASRALKPPDASAGAATGAGATAAGAAASPVLTPSTEAPRRWPREMISLFYR